MFKGLFKKKQTKNEDSIIVPLEGQVVTLENVPDPVFSKKMMGDGFAVEPANGTVISPVDGEVISVFPTKHAVSLKSNSGREILIHIGIETVNLNGEGFTSFVKDGQSIKQGQKLLEVNFEAIKPMVQSILTPVVFTNLDEKEKVTVEGRTIKII